MFLAHSIRLRHPWQCEPTANGGCRWSRLFHRPTGLEEDDQLLLVISGLPAAAKVTVNGHEFATRATGFSPPVPEAGTGGADPPSRYDLTPILADANQIEITLPPTSDLPPPTSFPYDARLAVIGHS